MQVKKKTCFLKLNIGYPEEKFRKEKLAIYSLSSKIPSSKEGFLSVLWGESCIYM